jgi:hypothetical protein
MKRAYLLALTVIVASAQSVTRDGYFVRYPFERYPFDQWLADGPRAQMRWTTHVETPRLTAHQRLSTRIDIMVDAKEIQKRRGRGEIVTFVQIEDTSGRRWRAHSTYSLRAIPADAKVHATLNLQEVYILPGDYTLTLAACDSKTREYSLTRRTLHVSPLRGDPLATSWRDLQPVEFVQRDEAPDSWFQPYIRGRMRLPLETRRPVHLDLVMNMTPSERVIGSVRSFGRNMSVLVPALKLLSNLEPSKGTLDVALLDLTRRKIWEQKNVRGLDWDLMRAPFANTNPGVIDVQSLAAKGQMTQFFWDQMLNRLRPDAGSDALHVMIVLSAPAFLEHQFKVEPASFPKDPNRRVFYLRYRPVPPPRVAFDPFNQAPMPTATSLPSDDLEHTLRWLDARVYSAVTPEEFRKALANVMAEVAKM